LEPAPTERRAGSPQRHREDIPIVAHSFEREYLLTELREHGWNISRTAGAIGIARESLSRKIKALGIEVERG
jgi:DNA-binding NtrC family response regulator